MCKVYGALVVQHGRRRGRVTRTFVLLARMYVVR